MTDLQTGRRAAERILEDESLTADLGDDAAGLLLDWGAAQAEAIARRAQQALDAQLQALRRTMNRINRQAGRVPLEDQPQRVHALLAEATLPEFAPPDEAAQRPDEA